MVRPVSIFSDCSTSIIDFGTIFRLCPMNGEGPFYCIPDVDDDCISDSQVMMTHGAVVFKCFPSTTITSNKNHFHKDIQEWQKGFCTSLYLC